MIELNLTLQRLSGHRLPVNYQHEVSSWIYKVISSADSQHGHFLHEKGFQTEGRSFKMFTFSQLDLRPYELKGEFIKLLGKEISLTVRFMVDKSMESFINGLFTNQKFFLGNILEGIEFQVSEIQTTPPPVFKEIMRYQCLSPICISRSRGDNTTEYISPESINFGELLVNNLVRKEKAFSSIAKSEGGLIAQDEHTIPTFRFHLLNRPRKKGIHIKANTESHTQLIGYLFNFELLVRAELHEIGYYSGFGEKNSMGFGCVEVNQ